MRQKQASLWIAGWVAFTCSCCATTVTPPLESPDRHVERSLASDAAAREGAPFDLPFEAAEGSEAPTPDQQELVDLYLSHLRDAGTLLIEWGVGVVGVEQPWIAEDHWLVVGGHQYGGHASLPPRWIGHRDGRYVWLVFGGEAQSEDERTAYRARSIHSCPWELSLGPVASAEALSQAGCTDHTEELLRRLFERARRGNPEGETLYLTRVLSSALARTESLGEVLTSTEQLGSEMRWHGRAPAVSPPQVEAEADRLRAEGLIFLRRGFNRPVLSFTLEATPDSLELTLSEVGHELIYIE